MDLDRKISKRRRQSYLCSQVGNISGALRRVITEYNHLKLNPIINISAGPKENNILEWSSLIIGPDNTLYAKGKFFLDITFPNDYPFKPPKVIFKTKIFHCNINSQGIVCVDILNEAWSPCMTIEKVYMSLISLLIECNPESALVGNLGNLYLTNQSEYNRIAKEWTKKFAI